MIFATQYSSMLCRLRKKLTEVNMSEALELMKLLMKKEEEDRNRYGKERHRKEMKHEEEGKRYEEE